MHLPVSALAATIPEPFVDDRGRVLALAALLERHNVVFTNHQKPPRRSIGSRGQPIVLPLLHPEELLIQKVLLSKPRSRSVLERLAALLFRHK